MLSEIVITNSFMVLREKMAATLAAQKIRASARVTGIALASRRPPAKSYGSHAQYLVRKRTFAYFLDNHPADGIVAVSCKVLPGDNKALAGAQPRQILSSRLQLVVERRVACRFA